MNSADQLSTQWDSYSDPEYCEHIPEIVQLLEELADSDDSYFDLDCFIDPSSSRFSLSPCSGI